MSKSIARQHPAFAKIESAIGLHEGFLNHLISHCIFNACIFDLMSTTFKPPFSTEFMVFFLLTHVLPFHKNLFTRFSILLIIDSGTDVTEHK